jgi:SAM-dependent methyltransferase
MNIDAALRYDPIVKFIKSKKKDNVILEVGSGVNGIADYYSGKVLGIDSDFSKTDTLKKRNITHKKGSILSIPGPKDEFSFVVCLDTLEHLYQKDRAKALMELTRVLKKDGYLLIAFPEGKFSKAAEGIIRWIFKKRFKKDHIWLSEHRKFGLPQGQDVINFCKLNNFEVKTFGNVNIFVWILVHLIFTSLSGSKLEKLFSKFSQEIYLLSKVFNLPPFYRRVFIIKKV